MGDNDVYVDGFVHVRAEQCDRCLFGKDRLVGGARARELVASSRATDGGSFVCHRNQVSTDQAAICRVWWDRFAMEDWILRLASAMGIVREVA